MKQKFLIFLFFFLPYSFVICQTDKDSNLIYNPSFEEHIACPKRIDPYGYMNEPLGWWQPTSGSADYYNNCGGKQCHVPKNKLGIQMPRTGGSMVGIYCSLTDYREYIETELKEKLLKGETYHLSFWVSLSEYSPEAVATIGGLFTDKMISDTTRQMITNNTTKIVNNVKQNISSFYKPQVVNPFVRVLSDTINWMKIEGDFIAEGGEKFLTIGNFYPAEQSNVNYPQGLRKILPGAYYYVDDVELYCLTCGKTDKEDNVLITRAQDTITYSVGEIIVLENIFFEFDRWELMEESGPALEELLKLLLDNPHVTIEIGAHTDRKGTEEYNMDLSAKRAQSVVDYLVASGIEKERLKAQGYGMSKPTKVTASMVEHYPFLKEGDVLDEKYIESLSLQRQEICDQINRRCEFKVLKTTYKLF